MTSLNDVTVSPTYVYEELPVIAATAHYELRVVYDGERYDMYGIVNKETGVIESFGNNLARSKYAMNVFEKSLTEGYKDPNAELIAALAAAGDGDEFPGSRKLS